MVIGLSLNMLLYKPLSSHPSQPSSSPILVSIDPSIKNLALRVESRDNNKIQSIIFERKGFNHNNLYSDVITYFDQYYDILHQASIMVIEKQLPNNYNAVRLSQHIITYFMIRYYDTISIYEIEPRLKSKMLGYDSTVHGNVKRWSISKAIEILTHYNDINGLNILNKEKKKDDLADTVCQIESFLMTMSITV